MRHFLPLHRKRIRRFRMICATVAFALPYFLTDEAGCALVVQGEPFGTTFWREGTDAVITSVAEEWGENPGDWVVLRSRVASPFVVLDGLGPWESYNQIGFTNVSGEELQEGGYYLPTYWDISIVHFNVPVSYAVFRPSQVYMRSDFPSELTIAAYWKGNLVASGAIPAFADYRIWDPNLPDGADPDQLFDEIRITGVAGQVPEVGISTLTVDFVPEPSASLLVCLGGLGLAAGRRPR